MTDYRRTESIELDVECEYDFEEPEREYFNAVEGYGHPGSPGGATLTAITLVIGKGKDAKRIDIPIEALSEKAIAYMEDDAYESHCMDEKDARERAEEAREECYRERLREEG